MLIKKIVSPLSRISLFIVFFWFGILKIIGTSPANPLVQKLFEKTAPFISFEIFIILFGAYEMLIGILFLIPKRKKLALFLLVPHMIATFLPLFLLPNVTWQNFFTPTLEGQYIIKNLVIIALALNLDSRANPEKTK